MERQRTGLSGGCDAAISDDKSAVSVGRFPLNALDVRSQGVLRAFEWSLPTTARNRRYECAAAVSSGPPAVHPHARPLRASSSLQ